MDNTYLAWARKYRLWIVCAALAIIAIIASRLMYWLGSIGIVWVIFLLTVAVGVSFAYACGLYNSKSLVKSFFASSLLVILPIGIIWAGIALISSAPDLNAGEVKMIMYYYVPEWRAVSAEYRGEDIWRVRMITPIGIRFIDYDEITSKISFVK